MQIFFSCNCVRRFFHVRSSRSQRHSGAERRLFPHALAGGAVSLLGAGRREPAGPGAGEISTEQLRAAAGELGLDASRQADPLWSSRGYLTLIRGTWHLLSFEQTLTLLNLTDAQLAALLKEDDFLWHKLGQFKPRTPDCRYRPLTEAERARTREIAAEMAALPECFRRDPAFAFVGDLTREEKSGGAATIRQRFLQGRSQF